MNSPTRTIDGSVIPAAGTWSIDPVHAQVAFVGRHFGLTKVRGIFGGVTGDVVIADDVTDSTVSVRIDMASVTTGDASRDDHLRSEELLNVGEHPTATFQSSSISVDGSSGSMDGILTMRGVAKAVSLDIDFVGYARDPWEDDRVVFSASGKVNREDWGVNWNMILEAGGLLVSKEIRIEIEVELVLQSADVAT